MKLTTRNSFLYFIYIILFLFILYLPARAQTPIPAARLDSLKILLRQVDEDDQKFRSQIDQIINQFGAESVQLQDLFSNMKKSDSINLKIVESVIDNYGWLGADVIGDQLNTTLFMVIQHADLSHQQKYLPIMRNAVKKGNAKPRHLALLEDRVALRTGNKQMYGSQVGIKKDNSHYVLPLIDPDNVDKRRSQVGLGPLSEYLKEFEINWDVEQYKKELPELEKEFFKK